MGVKQEYRVEITMYAGHRIPLGITFCELRFKDKGGFWVRLNDIQILVGNQKTLSSTKPIHAIVKSERTIEETGKIDLGEKFTLFNLDSGLKAGKGQVLEIVKQE